jgi:hypothetical protein
MNLAQRSNEEIRGTNWCLKKNQFGYPPPTTSPPLRPSVRVCMSNLSRLVPVFLKGAP